MKKMMVLVTLFVVASFMVSNVSEAADGLKLLKETESVFIDLGKRIMPTVVHVKTKKTEDASARYHKLIPPGWEDFFKQFGPMNPPRKDDFFSMGSGSGVIVDPSGEILTNNHVIDGADEIKVKLSNEEEFIATVIGTDPKTDLALIKIDAGRPLPAAKLGDSSGVQLGQYAIALGNPMGFERTMSVGFITGSGRDRVFSDQVIAFQNFFQTNADINLGNSGGPLINIDGEVIGINTAMVSGAQGIGFAAPINMFAMRWQELRDTGGVAYGFLGVGLEAVDPDVGESMGLKSKEGALVSEVLPDTPAEKAGVKKYDVIVEVNGKSVADSREAQNLIKDQRPGAKVGITVVRDGKRKKLEVELGERPSGGEESEPKVVENEWGMEVEEITPILEKKLNLSVSEGVVVIKVKGGGPAFDKGIRVGDVIEEMNRQPVTDLKDYNTIVRKRDETKPVLFMLLRADRDGGGSSWITALK
ncbi:trypsin-like peptidase domain-containing protein [Candidatus Hydrogenedentota bacterium]